VPDNPIDETRLDPERNILVPADPPATVQQEKSQFTTNSTGEVPNTEKLFNLVLGGPASPTAAAGNRPASPIQVSGFEIRQELGRGGMGVVYRALDLTINREVAIKFLHDRYSPGSSEAARFVEEARITGQLQHPGIPVIYQIGTLTNGRPYLAMKLIKGKTLQQLLADSTGSQPANWLAIFEAICQAVGYAHAHNVIHRDLKPHNVMVGSFAEVQVLDWGLAKVIGARLPEPVTSGETEIRSMRADSDMTQFGSLLGTPAYMPPEQARGQIDQVDRRSDVFSLGAILCVILTGKPPYVGTDSGEVLVHSKKGKIADAYARLDASGGEPDLIQLAKSCLSADPDERPADAQKVAAEVARLRALAEERARNAELEQAKTEEKRKRRRIQLALALSIWMVVSLVGIGLWLLDRRDQEKKLQKAQNKEIVQANLNQAVVALGRDNPIYGEIDAALNRVEPLLPTVDDQGAQKQFEQLKKDRQMVETLEKIDNRRWLVRVDQDFDAAYAQQQYPIAFGNYGLNLEAKSTAELATMVHDSSIEPRLLIALGAWQELDPSEKLLDLLNTLDPDPSRIEWRQMFAHSPGQVAEKIKGLKGRNLPAAFARFIGGHDRTPPDQAIRILKEAQEAHPNDFGLAVTLADKLDFKTQMEEKIFYYRIAVAIRPASATCRNNLALALHYSKGDPEASIIAYKEAIRLDPTSGSIHSNLAFALRDLKRHDEEIEHLEKAIEFDPASPSLHYNLALSLHQHKGDLKKAVLEYEKAIALDKTYIFAFLNLADALRDLKEYDRAITAYRNVARLDNTLHQSHYNLALIFHHQKKDLDAAIVEYKLAIQCAPKFSEAHYNLGLLYHWDKMLVDEAIEQYRQTIKLVPREALAHYNLALALHYSKRDFKGAIDEYKKTIEIDNVSVPPLTNLGFALTENGTPELALDYLKKAIERAPNAHQGYKYLAYAHAQMAEYRKAYDVLRDGFGRNPDWMTDINKLMRYDAAVFASQCGTGGGNSAVPEADRPRFRTEALNWLRADLAILKELAADPKNKDRVHHKLNDWIPDGELASVREPDQLAKLPDEERKDWEKLWAEVRKLHAQTANP
jgi:tetratricopeptide (TPR) repeat protein